MKEEIHWLEVKYHAHGPFRKMYRVRGFMPSGSTLNVNGGDKDESIDAWMHYSASELGSDDSVSSATIVLKQEW